MTPRRLLWHIFPANVLTIFVAVGLVIWCGAAVLHDFHLRSTEDDLEAQAVMARSQVRDFVVSGKIQSLRRWVRTVGRETGSRISVIAPNGEVLADSEENPDVMERHNTRVEVVAALEGRVGRAVRYSKTLGEDRIYVDIPVYADGEEKLCCVLRLSQPVSSLNKGISTVIIPVILVSLAVMFLAALVTCFISRNISRPLERMTRCAEAFADGNFNEQLQLVPGRGAAEEVVTLSSAMARMGALLDEKIQDIVTHHNQLSTIFSSMVEAVVAIDNEERIISLNEAAGDLFGVDYSTADGRLVQQVVRHVGLQQMISKTLASREAQEEEVSLHDDSGVRCLQASVVSLSDGQHHHVGVLVVLNDVTRLRRLEEIRRDFVANVSHELRTPVTSIQGYVETLLDGALDDRENAEHFLKVVLRQTQRLTAIFDDLLALSRIEDSSSEGTIVRQPGKLRPVVEEALQTCQLKAEENGVELKYTCPDGIEMTMNRTLIVQALVNLILNGITNAREGFVAVDVKKCCGTAGEEIILQVRDNGIGIGREHLDRIFERFYRPDKARSRQLGGTGLGLAIVKHIVQAHNGRAGVESVKGEGTTFTLLFPGKAMERKDLVSSAEKDWTEEGKFSN